MDRLIRVTVFIVAIVSVSCNVTTVSETEQMNHSTKTMGDESAHDHSTHKHEETYEVASSASAPNVTLSVIKDTMSGWNLELITSNFKFIIQW